MKTRRYREGISGGKLGICCTIVTNARFNVSPRLYRVGSWAHTQYAQESQEDSCQLLPTSRRRVAQTFDGNGVLFRHASGGRAVTAKENGAVCCPLWWVIVIKAAMISPRAGTMSGDDMDPHLYRTVVIGVDKVELGFSR